MTAGSLPPGLTMSAQSGSGATISGNPAKAGTFNFTVKAADGNLTSTLAYQITVTVQGSPDKLLCDSAGDFLESGTCVLPDAITGLPYAGQLVTSHNVGGTLGVVAGALPAGLSLPATFTGSGTTIGGTPAAPGIEPTSSFTVQGTDTQGQPLYQPYQITVDPNQPLTVVLPASGSTLYPGTVGEAFGINFFLSGGAAPYTWAVVAGSLPA
ncbi:MAG TPA: putative Ig domain-containing protein, partial [Streptosporangiaceae bacterium]